MAFKDDLELSTAKETTTGGGFEDDLKLVEPSYNVIGGLKTLGGSILRAPENIAAAALTAIKGKEGATVTKSDWMTDYIKEVDIRNKERSAEVEKEYGKGTKFVPGIEIKEVADVAPSFGFSGASMGGTVAGGALGALTPIPGGAVMGGMAGGGAVAYRADSYQAMQSLLDKVNQESIKERGRQITPEEEQQTKDNFSMFATKHGLWEAGPEAIGNVLEMAAMFAPWKTGKLIPKGAIGKVVKGAARMAGVYGTEQSTETVTQMGQQQQESAVGLTEEAPRSWTSPQDWWTSAKEVAPGTALLTTVMGVGGAGVNVAKKYGAKPGAPSTSPPPTEIYTAEDAGVIKGIRDDLASGRMTTEDAAAVRDNSALQLGEDHPLVTELDKAILDHATKNDLDPNVKAGMQIAEIGLREISEPGTSPLEVPGVDQDILVGGDASPDGSLNGPSVLRDDTTISDKNAEPPVGFNNGDVTGQNISGHDQNIQKNIVPVNEKVRPEKPLSTLPSDKSLENDLTKTIDEGQKVEPGGIEPPATDVGAVATDDIDKSANEAATSPENELPEPIVSEKLQKLITQKSNLVKKRASVVNIMRIDDQIKAMQEKEQASVETKETKAPPPQKPAPEVAKPSVMTEPYIERGPKVKGSNEYVLKIMSPEGKELGRTTGKHSPEGYAEALTAWKGQKEKPTKPQWYINVDDRPVLATHDDAVKSGMRGPYSKGEVSDLTGTHYDFLNKAKQGEPVYTLDNPKPKLAKAVTEETPLPYYTYFTKHPKFLPLIMMIRRGIDMGAGHTPQWNSFVQQFNEDMNAGNIPYMAPPSGLQGQEKGTVEWTEDEVLTLIKSEMDKKKTPATERVEITLSPEELTAEGFIEEVADDIIEKEDYNISGIKEELHDEGFSEQEITSVVSGIETAIKDQIVGREFKERLAELKKEVKTPPQEITEQSISTGELFNTSSMFTLSGGQPTITKTFKPPEKKGGDRLLDVKKQTQEELKERLSGEKAKKEFEEENVKPITYEEFSKLYRDAFEQGKKYTPKQAGFNVTTDTMAKLADNYPEYMERFDKEIEEEKLLLRVARATDTGKSAPFVTSGNQDRTEDNWRSGEIASKESIAAEKESVKLEEKKGRKVEEAGEELTYNKRNRMSRGKTWEDISGLNDALKAKETVKPTIWPKPDYAQLIADGKPVIIAHLFKQIYDSVANAPMVRGVPTDADFKLYIDAIQRIRTGVEAWMNNPDAIRMWAEKQAKIAGAFGGKPTSLTDIAKNAETLMDSVYPGGWKDYKAEVMIVGANKILGALQPGYDEVNRAIRADKKGWPGKQEAWQIQGLKVISRDTVEIREGYTWHKDQTKTPAFRPTAQPEKGHAEFDTRADAKAWISGLKPWLAIDKRDHIIGIGDTQEEATEAAREYTKRDKKDQISDKGISVAAAERTGPARRLDGEDITAEKLSGVFGFRGINFGNWMPDNERQLHLNHAYDSFHDLADILGIPPQAISLNGMLGVAFGAQGTGQYAAHFVPGVNEINLTRTAGAGSTSHEWGHGLDHYFATQAGLATSREPFLSEHTVKAKEGVRPEIFKAFKTIVSTMNQRTMTEEELKARKEQNLRNSIHQLGRWLDSLRRDFTGMEEAFDKLADRVRNGDYGEGKVAISPTAYVSPVLIEMRDLFKKGKGRLYSLDNTKAVQSWIDHVDYGKKNQDAAIEHIPQTDTQYALNALKLDKDKGGKRYWSTNTEKFARAFDAYVSDTVEGKAIKNTYLSHAGRQGETVPTGEERTAINKAFQTLVSTIETKPTDKGTMMFKLTRSSDLSALSFDIQPPKTPRFTVQQVEQFITLPLRRWGNIGEVKVIKTAGELPVRFMQAVQSGDAIFGAYDAPTDTTYIIADNIASAKAAVVTLVHEVVGHRGVHAILGVTEEKVVMAQITKAYENSPAMQKIARSYGFAMDRDAAAQKLFKKKWIELNEREQGEAVAEVDKDRRWAANELIAHMAESKEQPSVFQKIMGIIRAALRRVMPDMRWTDTDIMHLIERSRRFSGVMPKPVTGEYFKKEINEGQPMFKKTSDSDILNEPEFSLSKKGEDNVLRGMEQDTHGLREPAGMAGLLARYVSEGTGRNISPQTFDLVEPGTKDEKAIRQVAKLFGLDTVFWRDKTGATENINGFFNPDSPRSIFLNIGADKPLLYIAGHELIHSLKTKSPDLYNFLEDSIKNDVKEFQGYKEELLGKREISGITSTISDARILTDLIADFTGKQFVKKEFWDKLHDRNPAFTNKIVHVVQDILKKIQSFHSLFEDKKHFADVRKAQNLLADVLAKYQRQGANKEAAPVFFKKALSEPIPTPSTPPRETKRWIREHSKAIGATIVSHMPGNLPDMHFLERALKNPLWYEHPVLKKLYDVMSHKRMEIYHNKFTDFNDAGNDETVSGNLDNLRKKNPKGYQQLSKILVMADAEWVRDREWTFADRVNRMSVPAEVKETAIMVRGAFDKMLDERQKAMKELMAKLEEEGYEEDPFVLEEGKKNFDRYDIRPMNEFDSFWTLKGKEKQEGAGLPWHDGINYTMGHSKGGGVEVQAIHFNKEAFAPGEAETWWNENKQYFRKAHKDIRAELAQTLKGEDIISRV
jgi:hypothetical protein